MTTRRPKRPPTKKPSKGAVQRQPSDGGLPSKDQIIAFISEATGKVGKREIARAFGVTGGARIALKRLLSEMAAEGSLSGTRKALREKGRLPHQTTIEITGRDDDGDPIGKPLHWESEDGQRPLVAIRFNSQVAGRDVGIGDRILGRIEATNNDETGAAYICHPIKKLPRDNRRLLGIYRSASRGGGTIEPIDRKQLKAWPILPGDDNNAKDGDLVRFELVARGRFATPRASVVESLGNPEDQRQISLIAVHAHGIPEDFPESVIAEAATLQPPTLAAGREDLRAIPFVTIDPSDARDHDDAVHAEPDGDEKNPGGWIVTVAIADVAHFIRPGGKLDREARMRGNSVYFPDRVVPMLPERISNDLCSLREGEDRACLAVRMIFDRFGHKKRHVFTRGLMRSVAKLAYQEAQAAIDGKPSDKAAPLLDTVLKPLWDAYAALSAARDKRGPLDLDLPERRILLNAEGRVDRVITPERLTAHRLIEEFMIQANVAAAETLEEKRTELVYRVHDQPSSEKLKALKDFLETVGMKIPPAGALRASAFNSILERARTLPVNDLINEVVLRSQSQAEYAPRNIGHFGLNLPRYAHFTSPIRRYADLIVHRALIRALNLGDDGLTESEITMLSRIAEMISQTERRAMAAERETMDRLIAAHLADRVGAAFDARIAGVTRSGLFVRLKDTGADGYIPIGSLGDDYYHHVEAAHALVASKTGAGYQLGDDVEVKLVEALPMAGALRFELLSTPRHGHFGEIAGGRSRLSRRPGRSRSGGGKSGGGFRQRRR